MVVTQQLWSYGMNHHSFPFCPILSHFQSVEDSVVWALDRLSFRMLLVTAENTKKKCYESFLENIEIFSELYINECCITEDWLPSLECLTKYERSQLSDILKLQEYKGGECIIRQGDRGDKFYIVESVSLRIGCHVGIEVWRYVIIMFLSLFRVSLFVRLNRMTDLRLRFIVIKEEVTLVN